MNTSGLDRFCGRKEVLDLLKRRVLDLKEGYRQNVALLGERYVGKTLLMQKFLADLDDHATVPVFLDVENKDLFTLYQKMAASLLYHYAKGRRLTLFEDLRLLTESLQHLLPHTVRLIKKIHALLVHDKQDEAYRELISLPQVFAREADKFCVLFFDEFDTLDAYAIPDVFQDLGKKIMTQKRCLYVVASSRPSVARKILSEKLSLLFGNFEVVLVEPMDSKTCREFIDYQLSGIKIKDPLRNFLIDFSGGYPLYLTLICQELRTLCAVHSQDEIYSPLLLQGVENVLFQPWGALSRHFGILMEWACQGRGNAMVPRLLSALSNRKYKIQELAQHLEIKQNVVSQKLKYFLEHGLVLRNGGFYFLKDKLFRFWIKYVYQKELAVSFDDGSRLNDLFRKELGDSIEHFYTDIHKDLPSRIIELLHCFENESFLINGRRYHLPAFREVMSRRWQMSSGESCDVISASSEDGDWIIVLKPDQIYENDINELLLESKKLGTKPCRCVLISLSEMDESARLKALQERMWIWNEGELNALLNLYDKPYVWQG